MPFNYRSWYQGFVILYCNGLYEICISSRFIFDIYIISPFNLICLLSAGIDTNDLTVCPTDQHLVRLAALVPHGIFYELVIHLGLSSLSWNNIIEQYRGYDVKVVNFVALWDWRQQKKKKMKKTSFKDLSDALTKVDYNQHVLCQVGNK